MCGRFTNQYTWRELVDLYRITEPYIHPISNLEPRFNFAPMQLGVVVPVWYRTADASANNERLKTINCAQLGGPAIATLRRRDNWWRAQLRVFGFPEFPM